MKNILRSLIFYVWLITIPSRLLADPSPQETTKIVHLLSFIRQSKLTFIRNNTELDAAAAAAHVEQKYNDRRSKILSARDFIEKAASKSEISGQPYHVRLANGQVKLLSEVLSNELESQEGINPNSKVPNRAGRKGYECKEAQGKMMCRSL